MTLFNGPVQHSAAIFIASVDVQRKCWRSALIFLNQLLHSLDVTFAHLK